MNTVSNSLEYTIAQKFISEFISRNRLNDVPVILAIISESYGEKISYDIPDITKRQFLVAQSLIKMLDNVQTKTSVPQFITHAKNLYDEYVASVDIFLTSDSHYTLEVKDKIAHMCTTICGVKNFTMHEKISVDHGGGFIVRFRDYILDASYRRLLK